MNLLERAEPTLEQSARWKKRGKR